VIELIGHRGIPVEALENSITGFLHAIEAGASALELDVHATADRQLVVHHDAIVPTRSGTTLSLTSTPLATLRANGCDPDALPLLDDVLDAVQGRARLFVEVKARGIEALVARALGPHAEWCAVHSFDHRAIRRIHQLEPRLRCGVLVVARLIDPVAPLRDSGAVDYWQEASGIDPELVAAVHGARGHVIAWTVNDLEVAQALLAMSVDGICTDNVRALRRLLG
jgi:glycerophosphoryl diester phosphodiesterase